MSFPQGCEKKSKYIYGYLTFIFSERMTDFIFLGLRLSPVEEISVGHGKSES